MDSVGSCESQHCPPRLALGACVLLCQAVTFFPKLCNPDKLQSAVSCVNSNFNHLISGMKRLRPLQFPAAPCSPLPGGGWWQGRLPANDAGALKPDGHRCGFYLSPDLLPSEWLGVLKHTGSW